MGGTVMFTFILGTAKSGKKNKILKLLEDRVMHENSALLLVPEQFSFAAEKELLNKIKPEHTKNLSVMNFTSLATEVKRLYGGNTAKIVDNNTRIMLMHKVIKQLNGELCFFKSNTNSLNLITVITDAIIELKQSAVTYEMLINASNGFGNSATALKLHDLAVIMSAYDATLGDIYIDPIDELTHTYEKAKDNGYFKEKSVYFYGFSGFSGQQYKLIKQILIDSKEVTISLCTDGNFADEFSTFANVNETYSKLNELCKQQNIQVKNISTFEDNYYSDDSLLILEKKLSGHKVTFANTDVITAIEANTRYEELEYVATEIHRRVRTEGLRFRDFAIIARNTDGYISFCEEAFLKADVPIYVDKKFNFLDLPISSLVLSALKASHGFKTKNIYKYIKSGLTDLTDDEINQLDNYIYLWSIDKEDWLYDFTKNPFGLQEVDQEKINLVLEKYNKIRKKIIMPLIGLKGLKRAAAKEYCVEIYKFFQKCNVSKHLSEYAENLKRDGEIQLEQYLISGWNMLNDIFDNIFTCYGNQELSFDEFFDILSFNFNNAKLSGIPQGIDQVNFISADRVVALDVKNLYVIGLNYGEFPAEYSSNGIFNSNEKGFLKNYDIDLGEDYMSRCIEEDYIAYKSITSASHSLCLTTHNEDFEGSAETSPVFKEIVEHFNISVKNISKNVDIDSLVETPLQAICALSSNKEALEQLKCHIGVDEKTKGIIDMILSLGLPTSTHIDKVLAKEIYGNELRLSSSKLDQYFKCPYTYFYKFGLNINSRDKINFKAMQRGTIAHYVLEKILCKNYSEAKVASNKQIKILIDNYINEYIESNVGKNASLDAEVDFLLKRISAMLMDLVPYIIAELMESSFTPCAFEFDFSDDGDMPPITIKTQDVTAKIGGKVDRVDAATINGKAYIRIIDYKTGKKSFKLSDILYGLNLQMLIYLCAICENSEKQVNPAGIIYQPLNHIVRKGIDAKDNNAAHAKGIILDDEEVVAAMDPSGKYAPIEYDRSGKVKKTTPQLSQDEFVTVFDFVKRQIKIMCNELLSGKIEAHPCKLDKNDYLCEWCQYKNLCKISGDKFTVVENLTKEEIIENINKEDSKWHLS